MRKVLLLLSEGFEAFEASAFIDVFGWNSTIGSKDIKLVTSSIKSPIKTTWNLEVYTEMLLKDIHPNDFQAIIVPGGFGGAGFFQDTKSELFQDTIKKFNYENKYMVGVCTGVIPLAESGILKGKKATTYLLDNERYFMQLKKHGVNPVKKNIVIDQRIITSSAPGTAVEVAFILLELLTTKENSDFIKFNMGFKKETLD